MSKTFAVGMTLLALASAEGPESVEREMAPVMSEAMMTTMVAKEKDWAAQDSAPQESLSTQKTTEAFTACVNGMAGQYPCKNMDLVGHLPLSALGGGRGTDVWGWTSPSGREIAIACTSTGTSFVDVKTVQTLGFLPVHGGQASNWHDAKVYKNYAYIGSEAKGHGMQIFDLNQLENLRPGINQLRATKHYSSFGNSHNIVINEDSGYAYAVGTNKCSGGLYMMNLADPLNPQFEGCFSSDGYTHDAECVIYRGPDAQYQGREICFNYNEDTLTIVDVTNKAQPQQLSRTTYTGVKYCHQGWLTGDQQFVLMNDELEKARTGTKTFLWDVKSLRNPIHFDTYLSPNGAIAHNLYIKDDLAYLSNYNAGLRIVDASTVNGQMKEVAFFDVYPQSNGHTFSGVWSSYPYFASGKLLSQSIPGGLYITQATLGPRPTPVPPTTPVPSEYMLNTVGNCNGYRHVSSSAECEKAAQELGKSGAAGAATSPTNPKGCYWKTSSSSLWFNPAGDANDDDTDRVSICYIGAPVVVPSPTPSPVVVPSPTPPVVVVSPTPAPIGTVCKGAKFCVPNDWCAANCRGGANPLCTPAGGGLCSCTSGPAPVVPSPTPTPTGDCKDYNGAQCRGCLASNKVCYPSLGVEQCAQYSSWKWCA